MNEFGYCYVFDYSACAIYEIELTEEESNSEHCNLTEEILDRRGLKIDDCYVMYSNNKLSVEPIKLKDDESV